MTTHRVGALTGVRVLGDDDLGDAWALLSQDPIERVFIASRVAALGLNPIRLGCPIWGFFRSGELTAMCHSGANLVTITADDEALEAFAGFAGPMRRCSSIVGQAYQAIGLWQQLSARWGDEYAATREVRTHQPMLAIDHDPDIPADPRVQRITMDLLEPYFAAAVSMYTEEVGVSPVYQGNRSGYLRYVRTLIENGRAFGIVEGGRVIYKSDLGSVAQGVAQVQGVWLDPDLRGRGLAAPATASVVELTRRYAAPTVSLYVNDFNLAARATYARVGFEQVGEFATVLY